MKLVAKFKPAKYVARTRKEMDGKLNSGHNFMTTYSALASGCLADFKGDYIRVYNLEKRRPKFKVMAKPVKLTKRQKENMLNPPHDGLLKREKISDGHWVAYVYTIPTELLRLSGNRAIQGNRTFSIVPLKAK